MKTLMKRLFDTTTKPIEEPAVTNIKVVNSEVIKNEMFEELGLILNNNKLKLISNEVDELKLSNSEIIGKGNLLSKYGFTNTPSGKLNEQLGVEIYNKESDIRYREYTHNLIKKYAFQYPDYKFVTDNVFNSVREKYNLYTGTPKSYIKEIPNSNLEELDRFMVMDEKDKPYHLVDYDYYPTSEIIPVKDVKGVRVDLLENIGTKLFTGTLSECIKEKKKLKVTSSSLMGIAQEISIINITAPLNHFDLRKKRIEGREIVDYVVEDPIITKKVDGGYIIITAWDEEAEIPEIKM
jgi:hypothetical protein